MPLNLCSIGVDLDHWYPVCREEELRRDQAMPVVVWERRLVAFRDASGGVAVVDDRCAHRKVALHPGEVRQGRIVCPYHGWQFDSTGALAAIPYWPADKRLPDVRLGGYPTLRRAGLIWVFPGDAARAASVPCIAPTEAESPEWVPFYLDREFANHYAIGLLNGMDYYHFHLHRKYQPWSEIRTLSITGTDDAVEGWYEVVTRQGSISRVLAAMLGDYQAETVLPLRVRYLYPHHYAQLGDGLKVWAFFCPNGPRRVKAFITTLVRMRGVLRFVRRPFRALFSWLILRRIQDEDAWAGLREQDAWDWYPDEPRCETNPISVAAQKLMVRKWQQYQERSRQGYAGGTPEVVCPVSLSASEGGAQTES